MSSDYVFIKSGFGTETYAGLLMLGDTCSVQFPLKDDFEEQYTSQIITYKGINIHDEDLYRYDSEDIFLDKINHYKLLNRGGFNDYCWMKISDFSGSFAGRVNNIYGSYKYIDLATKETIDLIEYYKTIFQLNYTANDFGANDIS